jgi:hypothetical protein
MRTVTRSLSTLMLATMAVSSCTDAPTGASVPPQGTRSSDVAAVDESQSRIVVDAGQRLGPVMRFEQASTHSTSSPLPGDATRAYLRSLDQAVVRTWIQARYVYNNGSTDYNYKYESSNVGAEDALKFYAGTTKSVLIALSAYNPSSAWSMPQGDSLDAFLTRTLVYYKSKYPNVRYIQVGNEPDASDETMATYYPVYRHYYRAVNAANRALHLRGDRRLLISNGPFTSNLTNMLRYADGFLAAYAADPDPDKRLDFFSFHSYGDIAQPVVLATARQRIDAAMQAHGLPAIPVFVSEYGVFGGASLPVRFTKAELVTLQPAGQLTKAFYLYEGGVDQVFDWAIHHSSLPMKSQLADVRTAIPYPYGNAMLLGRKLSERGTRIAATSNAISANGLGTHVLASMRPGKGIAVLLWNFNWRDSVATPEFNVLVKNVPHSAAGGGRVRATIYLVDSKTNNYYTNQTQTSLVPTFTTELDYSPTLTIPIRLERAAVALIEITRADASCGQGGSQAFTGDDDCDRESRHDDDRDKR